MKKNYFFVMALFLSLAVSAQTIDSTLKFSDVGDTLMLQAIDVARTASPIADPLLSYTNPFQGETFDTAIISLDVFNYGDLHVLGALFSFFDGTLGRMYFTNGSYLGYNGVGGWYDANLLSYAIDSNFLENNLWKNVELMFTPTEFAVFVDGALAFADTSTNVTMGGEASTGGGAFADHDSVIYFLQNAASFVIGTGSWWSDNINGATGEYWDVQNSYIKNVALIAIQSSVADTTKIDLDAIDYAYKSQAVDVAACASSDADPALSYDNPLKGLDFSAADISFDVYTYFPDSIKVLGCLVSVFDTGDAGRMYFTNGSYLGYNGIGGYYDANLLSYGIDSSFITPGSWKSVKLHFDAAGYAVYVDNDLAFDNNSAYVTIAGDLTDHTNVIEFLQTASHIMIGTGSWWSSNTRTDGTYYDAQFSWLKNLNFATTEYPKEILSGGNMEDSTEWITYWRSDNADTGSFVFNYTDDMPAAGVGGNLKINAFGNSGAFAKKAVTITPGHAYNLSGAFKNISTDDITNSWVELICTRVEPIEDMEFGAGDSYVIYENNSWMSAPYGDLDIDGTFAEDFNYRSPSFDAPYSQNFVIADTVTQTEWFILIKAGSSNGDGVATPDINYLFDEISLKDLGIDIEAPTAPDNLAADDAGTTITWDASTDNIGVFHYILYDGASEVARIAAKETDNTYTFVGVTMGVHTFGIVATDQSGNESEMSTIDVDVPEVGVDQITQSQFSIFPNPSTGIVNIVTNTSDIATLKVYNMTGKLIISKDFTKDYQLDLSDVNSGLYFIYLKTEDGVQVEKLILQ